MDLTRVCIIFVQNNQLIFKLENTSPFVMWFGNDQEEKSKSYYQYLRELAKEKPTSFIPNLKDIVGRKVILIVSDDILPMDLRGLKTFLGEHLHCYDIEITYQSLYLSKTIKNYVAMIKTPRCIVMKYIKDRRVIQESFLPMSTEQGELKEALKELHSEIKSRKVPVLIIDNQEKLEAIESFGTLVRNYEIFENYECMRKDIDNLECN